MRQPFVKVVTRIAFVAFSVVATLSLGGLAGCAGPEAPAGPPSEAQALPNAIVFGEFTAHMDPKSHKLTFERVGEARAYGPNLEPQSLDSLPIVSDGVAGSGPANTVELVSTNCVDSYPATQSFQCDVTLRHFYDRSFANVFVQVTSINVSSGGAALDNHQATNSDTSQFGLSSALGLWEYTADASTNPGVLAQAPNNAGTRTWIFNNPDDANDSVSLVVYGSLGFANYTFGFPNLGYVDACSGGTSSTTSSYVSTTMPFDFTFFDTNSTTVKFVPRNSEIVVGTTAPSVSQTPVSLPSTTAPHPAIFPFWDALKYGTGGKMCYQTLGSAPNRQFLIEFRNMDFFSAPGQGSSLDFEAYLFEGTGEIDFVYNSMVGTGTSNGRENGAKAMVGVQNEGGTVAAGEYETQDFGSGNAWSFLPSPI